MANVQMQVPAVWVGADDLPVQFLNAFLMIVQPGEIFLTLGSYQPPPIVGATVEEREAAAKAVSFVPVKPIARVGMTPDRLRELIRVLEEGLQNYEKMMALQEGSPK